MDKSFLVFMGIGIGVLYLTTNFIGDIQQEDDRYQNEEYKEKNQFNKYQTIDSIGRSVLDLTGVDSSTQLKAWNKSNLKNEFLEVFPDFDEMKKFVKERTRGDALQTKLRRTIDTVENGYFSGTMSAEEAKRMLSSL